MKRKPEDIRKLPKQHDLLVWWDGELIGGQGDCGRAMRVARKNRWLVTYTEDGKEGWQAVLTNGMRVIYYKLWRTEEERMASWKESKAVMRTKHHV